MFLASRVQCPMFVARKKSPGRQSVRLSHTCPVSRLLFCFLPTGGYTGHLANYCLDSYLQLITED